MADEVTLVADPSNPFFFMYFQSSTEQSPDIAEMTGPRSTATTTGMINEQVPVIWETDVFLGQRQPPEGYTVYRYANGSDYSGYMRNGQPNGYGVMRGAVISYIGIWEDGIMVEGLMVDAVRASEFQIPWASPCPTDQRSPDPQ